MQIVVKGKRLKSCQRLGEGSQGAVYKCHDPDGKIIVLKRMTIKEVRREAAVLERIKNSCDPWLTCFEEVIFTKNNAYIISSYVPESKDLYSLLFDEKQELSFKDRIGIATNLAAGLAVLHENDVIHNDIKPENIIIDKQLRPRYIDFGLSCIQGNKDTAASCGKANGTPIYMHPILSKYLYSEKPVPISPEEWKRADVWSLGIVFVNLFLNKEHFGYGHKSQSSIDKLLETYAKEVDDKYRDVYISIIAPMLRKDVSATVSACDVLVKLRSIQFSHEITDLNDLNDINWF
jgi:serine/threonine protein kinase